MPKRLYAKLGKAYTWFDEPYQRITVFEDGHSTTAGEAPFTKNTRIRELFEKKTGHDPSGYLDE